MDVARLINEVYKRNGIWDHHTSCHYMRDAVASLWNEIAEVLEAPVDAVKAKWRNLRDTYTAECRKMYKQCRDKEPVTRSKWVWFSSMDFLRPHLKRLRELQEGKFHINNTSGSLPIRNNSNSTMSRTRLKKLLKAEHFKTEPDDEEQSLIENVEVDIMPNEALLHAVTHLEEDEDGTVITDAGDDNDNSMNIAVNPAFAFNYTTMMNTNNSTNHNHETHHRNHETHHRKRHWQITTPISFANSTPTTTEPERKRRRQIGEDITTLRPGEVDDTYHFLISLREPLKSLSLDRQMYVRYKIQELLFNETSECQKNLPNDDPLDTTPEILSLGNIKTEPPDTT